MANATFWGKVHQVAWLSTLPIALATAIADGAQAFGFTHTYVFGDSLSDSGNLFTVTGGLFPPPPYAQRLSNGPVWVEYLAPKLGTPLTSFAIAGASTGSTNTRIPVLGGISNQIDIFKVLNPVVDPDALYILWGGANDYLGGRQTDPTIPVTNLTNSIVALFGAGARNIAVANLPNLGALPGTSGNPLVSQGLAALTSAHNTLLAQSLNQLEANPALGPQLNLITLDLNSLFSDAIANPTTYSLTNVASSCIFPPPFVVAPGTPINVCANPADFLFWDDIHPTTTTHAAIAEFAFAEIETAAVPEPATTVGIFTFAAFLGGARRLKQKRDAAPASSKTTSRRG